MLSFFWGVDHPLGPSAYAACPVLMHTKFNDDDDDDGVCVRVCVCAHVRTCV